MYIYFLYLDPGSGSYLVQVIAAVALGIVFFFKNIKLYIRAFFSRFSKKNKDNPPEQ
jgi:hypothetical protein